MAAKSCLNLLCPEGTPSPSTDFGGHLFGTELRVVMRAAGMACHWPAALLNFQTNAQHRNICWRRVPQSSAGLGEKGQRGDWLECKTACN